MEDRVLHIERIFNAPQKAVFTAFTDPNQLAKWWGPQGMTTPDVSLDARVGGKWETTMVNSEGDSYTCSGVYRHIDPFSFIAFTWGWRQPDGSRGHETVIEISFEETQGGTKMIFNQKTFQDAEARTNHEGGWTSSFVKLAQFITETVEA